MCLLTVMDPVSVSPCLSLCLRLCARAVVRFFSKSVDMWSIGVIIFILLGGYPPFHHENQSRLFRKVMSGKFQFHEEYWGNISVEAKVRAEANLIGTRS